MRRHAKKLMYIVLLLILGALYAFKPHLTQPHSVVSAEGSVDKLIRNGNFIASRPISVQRGDIVVYEMDNLRFVRRLIGLPGDVISVANGGIFIDKKPMNTMFLEKGAPIVPAYNGYTVPPNQIVIGTGAIEPGVFRLIEIDLPDEMRYGELVFSAAKTNRGVVLSVLVGIGYVLLLVFGPLVAEKWMDPKERGYGLLKFLWYAGWLVLLPALFFGHEGLSWWQGIQVSFVGISVWFTSLLVYLGASLKASAIMSLLVGISGIASFMVWLSKAWHHVKSDGTHEAT